jgi:hypothetical protein
VEPPSAARLILSSVFPSSVSAIARPVVRACSTHKRFTHVKNSQASANTNAPHPHQKRITHVSVSAHLCFAHVTVPADYFSNV